jgi:hypothetical protein
MATPAQAGYGGSITQLAAVASSSSILVLLLSLLPIAAAQQPATAPRAGAPLFTLPVEMPHGVVQLPFPVGADPDQVALQFGNSYGVAREQRQQIARQLLDTEAELSGKKVRFVITVTIGGTLGAAHLAVYENDNHMEKLRSFATKHSLNEDAYRKIQRVMAAREAELVMQESGGSEAQATPPTANQQSNHPGKSALVNAGSGAPPLFSSLEQLFGEHRARRKKYRDMQQARTAAAPEQICSVRQLTKETGRLNGYCQIYAVIPTGGHCVFECPDGVQKVVSCVAGDWSSTIAQLCAAPSPDKPTLEPTPWMVATKETGACQSDVDCASGLCRGGNCCIAGVNSENCVKCYRFNGKCMKCSSEYSRTADYQCVREPGGSAAAVAAAKKKTEKVVAAEGRSQRELDLEKSAADREVKRLATHEECEHKAKERERRERKPEPAPNPDPNPAPPPQKFVAGADLNGWTTQVHGTVARTLETLKIDVGWFVNEVIIGIIVVGIIVTCFFVGPFDHHSTSLRPAPLPERQQERYMPPLPDSPMTGRSLATSEFKTAYGQATVPEGAMDLGMELGKLLEGYCQAHEIDWLGEGRPFLRQLQQEALQNAADPIDKLMQRMWTSAAQLRGREFCFLFNDALRLDSAALSASVAALARGVNTMCVSVPPTPPFPPNDVCFRGGGFDDQYRDFFVPRRHFRIPNYFATSFSQAVADGFLRRSPLPSKVRWAVHIDPVRHCVHVNLVTRRVPGLPDEKEYLFAPYSTFTVRTVQWKSGSDADPHVIELEAAVDNKAEPEDLPLAPWS